MLDACAVGTCVQCISALVIAPRIWPYHITASICLTGWTFWCTPAAATCNRQSAIPSTVFSAAHTCSCFITKCILESCCADNQGFPKLLARADGPHALPCRPDTVVGYGTHHITHGQKQGKLVINLQSKKVCSSCCHTLTASHDLPCNPLSGVSLPCTGSPLAHSGKVALLSCLPNGGLSTPPDHPVLAPPT